ncbi:peptidylprolyl isomerase [Ferruginibacter sp. HRS2-29]|uniref:peptidylprolyl isomerase n=1 Tax=Ferruginibacter sp. HRS2-29 TaxID=2487334 RepID=UPI0020CF278B|nr:peptidylprolyl isomerase [Ferruginibacter sp. HRS2-29]MCP9750489.1 peptidylprolyl isomerase [Ferruginibacter sp. HRS2-29]
MKGKFTLLLCACTISLFSLEAQTKKAPAKKTSVKKAAPAPRPSTLRTTKAIDKSVRIKITTDSGIIIVKLYDSTPIHRDNFVKLVKEGFYDSLMFHRVIPQFMIQGGDPTSKYAEPAALLGNGGDNMERLTAEIKPQYFHKRGVLAAARDGNPEKKSSACQFYLVEGKIRSDEELNMIELQGGFKYTPEQREIYKKIGGTPHLDMKYTVFGEVIEGLDIISKISRVPTGRGDRPIGDIRMKMEILK